MNEFVKQILSDGRWNKTAQKMVATVSGIFKVPVQHDKDRILRKQSK